MYICCVCVFSSPPGYIKHFKSIWRVWGIVAIGSAGEFSIWIKTRKYPNLKPWNHKNQKRGHLGLEWYARYQKHGLEPGNSTVASDNLFVWNRNKTIKHFSLYLWCYFHIKFTAEAWSSFEGKVWMLHFDLSFGSETSHHLVWPHQDLNLSHHAIKPMPMDSLFLGLVRTMLWPGLAQY